MLLLLFLFHIVNSSYLLFQFEWSSVFLFPSRISHSYFSTYFCVFLINLTTVLIFSQVFHLFVHLYSLLVKCYYYVLFGKTHCLLVYVFLKIYFTFTDLRKHLLVSSINYLFWRISSRLMEILNLFWIFGVGCQVGLGALHSTCLRG